MSLLFTKVQRKLKWWSSKLRWRQLTFLVRLPFIPLAFLTPKVFLAIYKKAQLNRFLSALVPLAKYCRGRLIRNKSIQSNRNHSWKKKSFDVTIIIPVFNHENYIGDAIYSAHVASTLAGNHGIKTEIIVVNDCSKDNSKKIAEQIIETLETPAEVLSLPSNCGLSFVRNAGIKNAQGRFLAFLDSDNTLAESAILNLYNALDGTDAAAAYGQIKTTVRATGKGGLPISDIPYSLPRLLSKGNYIDAMAMYRAKTLKKIKENSNNNAIPYPIHSS